MSVGKNRYQILRWSLLLAGIVTLCLMIVMVRLSIVTDYMYAALVKDADQDPAKWSPSMAWIAWRLGAPESVPALVARVKSPRDRRYLAVTLVNVGRRADALKVLKAHVKEHPQDKRAKRMLEQLLARPGG